MRLFYPLAAGLLAALLSLAPALAAEDYSAAVAEFSAQVQLLSAQHALAQLASESEPAQRRQSFSIAITALTSLYQLHGCSWALAPLEELYASDECPELFFGYSADGRIALRVERLELSNPIFAGSAVYLCQLQSNSSLSFLDDAAPLLSFELADGSLLQPDLLHDQHALWEQLDSLAPTFEAPASLASGAATAFKQLYATDPASTHAVSKVRFKWSEYSFELPVPRGKRSP